MTDKLSDKLEKAKNFFILISALTIPISGFINIILIPKNKITLSRLTFRFYDCTYTFLCIATLLLFVSIITTFSKSTSKKLKPEIGYNLNDIATDSSIKWSRYWFFFLSIIVFVTASIFYLKKQLKTEGEQGIFGLSFGQKEFDDKLNNQFLFSSKQKQFNFNFLYEKDSLIENDTEYKQLLFKNFYNNGLFFTGNYTSSEGTQSIFVDLKWIGLYDETCTIENTHEIPLLLSGCKLHIDTSISIVHDFILGYWYLHDCKKLDEASNCFNNILNDTSFQRRLNTLPDTSPLKKFQSTVKKLNDFSNEKSNDMKSKENQNIKTSLLPYNKLLQLQDNQIYYKTWLKLPVWISEPDIAIEYRLDTCIIYYLSMINVEKTGNTISNKDTSWKEEATNVKTTKIATKHLDSYLKGSLSDRIFYRIDEP